MLLWQYYCVLQPPFPSLSSSPWLRLLPKNGYYFITLCTQGRESLFGKIINDEMQLNQWGNIIWQSLPQKFPITLQINLVEAGSSCLHKTKYPKNWQRNFHKHIIRDEYDLKESKNTSQTTLRIGQ